MAAVDLTPIERAIYEAGLADARAQRWRIEAELRERDGADANQLRQYQRKAEAEAADAWRRLAALKGEALAPAAE